MRRIVLRALATALGAVLSCAVTSPASADPTKSECIEANRQAQSLRRLGRLGEARSQLRVCLDPACPKLVSADCAQRLDELDRAQPTILFDVKDAEGQDIASPEISVDGRPLQGHAEGTPIALDPGAHTFVFRAAGRVPATREFVLKEGDRVREERVQLEAPTAESISRASPAPAGPTDKPRSDVRFVGRPPIEPSGSVDRQRTAGAILIGVGGAGFVAASVFAGLAAIAKAAYEQHCGTSIGAAPSRCNGEGLADHDDAVTKANMATGSLLVGAVATTVGVTLLLSARPTSHPTALRLSPTGAWLYGRF